MIRANLSQLTFDLAGNCLPQPNYFQNRSRINHLIDRYLAIDILGDRFGDLSDQFRDPRPRPWQPLNWQKIHRDQIIGIDPDLFCSIVAGATEIEAPIRDYAQESWAYLQQIYPQMAIFMGGERYPDGSVKTLGVWEKEERQHAPTFRKLYHLLTGETLCLKPNSVRGYQSMSEPWEALSYHVVSRIATEWSAVSMYLWLMAHSTGELQLAIAQPLQDEVNHLAKFWGFSQWAFANSYLTQVTGSTQNLIQLLQHHQGERTQGNELFQKAHSIDGAIYAVELAFTFTRVIARLGAWNAELSPSFLKYVLGTVPTLNPSIPISA